MMEFFWRRLRRGDRGFTLIELLIVVAIIAILAAILIPNFLRARGQSRVAATKGNMKNLGTALESFFVQQGYYPNEGGLSVMSPGFVRSIPTPPGGGVYAYKTVSSGTTNLDYVICDNTTDVGVTRLGETTWYYTPSGGLADNGGNSVTITFIGGTSGTCP